MTLRPEAVLLGIAPFGGTQPFAAGRTLSRQDDAAVIEADDCTTMGGHNWKPKRLIWEGQDFLEAAKNDSLWEKTKTISMEKAGVLTFDILKATLSKLALSAIKGLEDQCGGSKHHAQ